MASSRRPHTGFSRLGKNVGLVLSTCALCLVVLLSWGLILRIKDPQGAEQLNSYVTPGFNHRRVITVVAFDRFHYFEQCVSALRRARGSDKYFIIINIDGAPVDLESYNADGRTKIVSYSRRLQMLAQQGSGYSGFADVLVEESDVTLGVWANKKRAIANGFKLSDFVIIVEDDIVLAQDALLWFEWHVTSGFIFQRPEVAISTCFALMFPYHPNRLVESYDILAVHTLGLLSKHFVNQMHHPWGWAMWRHTWDVIADKWTGQDIDLMRLMIENGWFESQPMVARCNNIGAFGVQRRGPNDGTIHQRLVTSSDFHNIDSCLYSEMVRLNSSASIGADYPYLFTLLRHGASLVEISVPLEEYHKRLLDWKSLQPKFWESNC